MINETMRQMIVDAEYRSRCDFSSSRARFVLGIPEFQALFGELSQGYLSFPTKAAEEAGEIVDMAREMKQNVFAGIYFGIRMEVSSSCVGIHLYFGDGDRITRNPLNSRTPKDDSSELILGLVEAIRGVLNQIEEVTRGKE